MKLSLGFSPCPNDTFIFDAMVHGKIDTEGLEFEVYMEDVEKLNQWAMEGKLDITKLSYHAFAYLTEKYSLLHAGSALGNNCGPLLIAKKEMSREEVNQARIAIPGKYTTANFLLSLAYAEAKDKTEVLFSEIEAKVLDGTFDAGLIIHENRFTYQEKGLIKIIDCGEYWEGSTGHPIPLGGIVAKNDLSDEVRSKIDRIMRCSVQYAFDHPDAANDYVKCHAQEMDESVRKQHINLYVNAYTLDLGEKGRAAVQTLFDEARRKHIIDSFNSNFFINYDYL
jgi:1,4-dihydroxy-6-naphthoate synthase